MSLRELVGFYTYVFINHGRGKGRSLVPWTTFGSQFSVSTMPVPELELRWPSG